MLEKLAFKKLIYIEKKYTIEQVNITISYNINIYLRKIMINKFNIITILIKLLQKMIEKK